MDWTFTGGFLLWACIGFVLADFIESLRTWKHPRHSFIYVIGVAAACVTGHQCVVTFGFTPFDPLALFQVWFFALLASGVFFVLTFWGDVTFLAGRENRGWASVEYATRSRRRTLLQVLLRL